MIDEIQTLLDDYLSWLRDRTVLREVNDCVEITTPYLDRHNDYLQIYAKRANGGFLLTDDGYVVDDLEQCGCKIDSGKRSELVHTTLRGFGVELRKKAIEVRASKEDFQLRKHSPCAGDARRERSLLSGAAVGREPLRRGRDELAR